MDDLVQFLRDRLDEDDAAARAAAAKEGGGTWKTLRLPPMNITSVCGQPQPGEYALPVIVDTEDTEDTEDHERAVHIARHDPARVLREVEAKRRLLDEVVPEVEKDEDMIEDEWHTRTDVTGDLVRLLALPYADHPNYQDAWRP